MRLIWTTDPHMNHVRDDAWQRWVDDHKTYHPDAILLTGDLSEGDDVARQLRRLANVFSVPIFFVLGNHDFYNSSIGQTRADVIAASRDTLSLHYLTDSSPIELQDHVFLLGDDGWGDATVGDYEGSTIQLNDFRLIKDFSNVDPAMWKRLLREQGEQSAERLRAKLDLIPDDAAQILVMTHVPPFREACWYMGKTTDDNWAPFFVCGCVGRVLSDYASRHLSCQTTVICGHTHHDGIAKMSDNLTVYTGAADYGRPAIEAVIDLEIQGDLQLAIPQFVLKRIH